MNNVQIKEAISMVNSEVNRLAMCKRGTVETDIHNRKRELHKGIKGIPMLTRVQQVRAFKKNRKELLACLVYGSNTDCLGTSPSYTEKSKEKYNKMYNAVMIHPDHMKVAKKNEEIIEAKAILEEQKEGRIATIDDEVKRIRMATLTGLIEYKDFTDTLDTFEMGEW